MGGAVPIDEHTDPGCFALFRERYRKPPRRTPFSGLQVHGLALASPFTVETARALEAGIAFADQSVDQAVFTTDRVKRVVLGQDRLQALDDVDHEVQPDQIVKPEHAGLGDTHGAAHQRIGLFYAEATSHRFVYPDLQGVNTDAVGEESRCIATIDDSFAHLFVVERPQGVHDVLVRFVAPDKFEESHVSNGIEEVRDGETAPKRPRHAIRQQRHRDSGGVG